MERFTVAANVNGVLSTQRPAAFNTGIPISFPVKPSINHHHHKDPSFTSFVRPENSASISTVEPEISIFGAERYFNDREQSDSLGCKRDAAAPVLDRPPSERCDLSSYPRGSSVSSLDGYGKNSHLHGALPTTTGSSEASWNSQSGLLSNPTPNKSSTPRQQQHRKGLSPSNSSSSSSSACKWFFGRSCPCSGRRSVDVEENFAESKSHNNNSNFSSTRDGSAAILENNSVRTAEVADPSKDLKIDLVMEEMAKLKLVSTINWDKEEVAYQTSILYTPRPHYHRIINPTGPFSDATNGGFSFPILAKPTSQEDPPRDSLEVFRPKDDDDAAKTTPNTTTTDFHLWRPATPPSPPPNSSRRSFAFPLSPKGRASRLEDDVASDSSSDLFEIESFSTSQMTASYRRRDSLDEILETRRFPGEESNLAEILTEPPRHSDVPSECYAPSEVSVQWSVTTADGFDRASAANFSSAASDFEAATFTRQETAERSRRKGNGGLLTSCICEKAVNVGPHPVRCVTERGRVGAAEVGRAIGNGGGVPVHGRPPLARSNSARMSRPIQTR